MANEDAAKRARAQMIAQNMRKRGRARVERSRSQERTPGRQISPLDLARMREGAIPYPEDLVVRAGIEAPAPASAAPQVAPEAPSVAAQAAGADDEAPAQEVQPAAEASPPTVTPKHRGSGRWSAEVDGVPLKDAESGEVALFESREAAAAAGAEYLAALAASEDRGD
jgi:hypothetical protein